jgi:2-phosphosulfolactate phosphatase
MPFHPYYVSIEGAARITSGTAVIIDVLRAYTTAAWAFALGAERIVLTDDVDEALVLKALVPRALAMKDSHPLPGFELSNSPVELQTHDLHGRTIVQRTTHGTVGAVAAKQAERLYCASFLTAAATADAILRTGAEGAYFVVTGEGGAAEEDLACAEYIAALVEQASLGAGVVHGTEVVHGTGVHETEVVHGTEGIHPGLNPGAKHGVDPAPYTARVAASNQARIHAERVAVGTPGVHALDVQTAMEADRFDFVMTARQEHLDGFGPVLTLRRRDPV